MQKALTVFSNEQRSAIQTTRLNDLDFISYTKISSDSVEFRNLSGSTYHPYYYILYVKNGFFRISSGEKVEVIPTGSFLFIERKKAFQMTTILHNVTYELELIAFVLFPDVLKKLIKQLALKENQRKLGEVPHGYCLLANNPILRGFFSSLSELLNGDTWSPKLVEIKTEEALIGVLSSSPSIINGLQLENDDVNQDLNSFMRQHYLEPFSIVDLAVKYGRSPATFYRQFKEMFYMPPHRWILQQRLEKAKELLENSSLALFDICVDVGFSSYSHFSKSFKRYFGVSPSTYRL